MARIVVKFGGTSVGDTDRLENVARMVQLEVERGHQIAVVVSAMSGVTNQLVGYVDKIAPLYDAREYDVVVSTGEQVTIGLLALALQKRGVKARSFASWQLPIRTNEVHGRARIQSIDPDVITGWNIIVSAARAASPPWAAAARTPRRWRWRQR